MNQAGKGDKPRPVNKKKYDENYDRIFGKGKSSRKSKNQVDKSVADKSDIDENPDKDKAGVRKCEYCIPGIDNCQCRCDYCGQFMRSHSEKLCATN